MAVTQVGSVTSFAMTAGAANATLNVPTGVVDGNLLLACVWGNDASFTPTFTGWTALGAQLTGSASGRGQVWCRVASSEPASYTPSWSVNNKYVGAMLALAGVDTTVGTNGVRTPVLSSYSTGTVRTTGSVTPTAGDWVVAFFGDRSTGTGTTGWSPTEPTELADVNNAAAGSSPRASLEVVWSAGSVAGSALTWTSTANTSQANAFSWIASIAPAGAAAASPRLLGLLGVGT